MYKYDSANRLVTYVRGDNSIATRCSGASGAAPTGAERSRRWFLDGVGNWKQTLYRDYSGTDNLDERAMTNFKVVQRKLRTIS